MPDFVENPEIAQPSTPEIEQQNITEFEQSTEHPEGDNTRAQSEQMRYPNADEIYE
jgi:hypothetical protein